MAGGGFGVGQPPWGGAGSSGGFDVVAASAVTHEFVDVVFSDIVKIDTEYFDPNSYQIPGLAVLGVITESSTVVRLYTSPQVGGQTYTVTVVGDLRDLSGQALDVRSASFTGIGLAPPYVVTSFNARADCRGRVINLMWTLPDGAQFVKVVRRPKNWVFDLTDEHDVVYEGTPISSFSDTGIIMPHTTLVADAEVGDTSITVASTTGLVVGDLIRIEQLVGVEGVANYELREIDTLPGGGVITFVDALTKAILSSKSNRVAKSTQLLEQTFYYYTVFASTDPAPPDDELEHDDNSRSFSLSIKEMDSRETFFWRGSPQFLRERDQEDRPAGSEGFYDKWYTVMGCWLNLMRGWANAIQRMNDDDESPFPSMAAKNQSLGIEPEGFSYDFTIPRRSVLSLMKVYRRKGTCEGLIRAARMFVKWDTECAEFGLGGCNAGPSVLKAWDGIGEKDENSGVAGTVDIAVGTLTDTTKTWPTDKWRTGFVIGALGDKACIDSNTDTELALRDVETVLPLSIATSVYDDILYVGGGSTEGIYPQMTIQITTPDGLYAEIHRVWSVNPNTSILLEGSGVNYAFPIGSTISIEKNFLRREIYFSTGVGGAVEPDGTYPWQPVGANKFVENEFAGFILLGSDNVERTIVRNDQTKLYTATLNPVGQAAIAKAFTLGGSFGARQTHLDYEVYIGDHSFIYEPTFPLGNKGTKYDPFTYIWQGPGSTILGAWGSNDIGLYVLTDVAVHIGKASTVFINTLDLDGGSPPPAGGALVGMYLNPNQNQRQLFRILANTTSTITVGTDISSLVVPGQIYYVLKPRDAARFLRLSDRFGPPEKEFAHMDIDVHILFQ